MHPTYKRMLAGLKKTSPKKVKPADRWYLYLLRCGDSSLYTGITNNLERRLKMHQAGKASRYTRTHAPVEMIYSETCGDRSSALIRECEVKEWPRKKKEKLIAGEKIVPKKRHKRTLLKKRERMTKGDKPSFTPASLRLPPS